jgi:hypothetical protein
MVKKLILDIDELTWKEVLKFKIDEDADTCNDAVVKLIKAGLKHGRR